MKYLTKIIVDKKLAASKRLHDPYAWHQALWPAFPEADGNRRIFLHRVDSKDTMFQVLLLSGHVPVVLEWGTWEIKKISENFLSHDFYRFELRANPTIKRVVRKEDGTRKKNGRRTAICKEEDLENWLTDKASQSGVKIVKESLDISAPVPQIFWRKKKSGRHSKVDFKGALKVIEQDLFINAFAKGIGPSKSFGFGMLMLQPA